MSILNNPCRIAGREQSSDQRLKLQQTVLIIFIYKFFKLILSYEKD